MHLITSAHTLDSDLTPALVATLAQLPSSIKLSLATKPGRDASVAYEATYRTLPHCRLIATWSEQESLIASACGWREDIYCWWPVSEKCDWPDWRLISHLRAGYDRVLDAIGKPCPVGFRGVMADGSLVEHEGCSCVACDALQGPVMFHRSMATGIARRELEGLQAGLALCRAVRLNQRRGCYQVPDAGVRC